MKERTLVIIKPDAFRHHVEFDILRRFQQKGLEVSRLYQIQPSEAILREHYTAVIAEKGEDVGSKIVQFMTSGLVLVAVLEGDNAVTAVRQMAGDKTEPVKCSPGTIRHDYSCDSYDCANKHGRSVENIIHSSDSAASAEREIALWFPTHAFEQVASFIGCLPLMLEDLVAQANQKKLMFHGVKNAHALESIMAEGLKPLTPEGNCSYWATGAALFYPVEDSPFFAHSGHAQPGRCELVMAVTNADVLGVPYVQNSTIQMKETVFPGALAMLRMTVAHPPAENHTTLRRYRRTGEQLLLYALGAQVFGQLTLGQSVFYNREVTS